MDEYNKVLILFLSLFALLGYLQADPKGAIHSSRFPFFVGCWQEIQITKVIKNAQLEMHNFPLLLFFDKILSPFELFCASSILVVTFGFLVKYPSVMALPIWV